MELGPKETLKGILKIESHQIKHKWIFKTEIYLDKILFTGKLVKVTG